MSHPLTDEVCRYLADTEDRLFTSIEMDNMRAAADWQLEQVIEWLKNNTDHYMCEDYYKTYFLTETFLEDLKQAMRPTQEKN